jgi:hypothetical protein
VTIPAGAPSSNQVPGDCQRKICTAEGLYFSIFSFFFSNLCLFFSPKTGNTTSEIDNTDLPVDASDCTENICTNGLKISFNFLLIFPLHSTQEFHQIRHFPKELFVPRMVAESATILVFVSSA